MPAAHHVASCRPAHVFSLDGLWELLLSRLGGFIYVGVAKKMFSAPSKHASGGRMGLFLLVWYLLAFVFDTLLGEASLVYVLNVAVE